MVALGMRGALSSLSENLPSDLVVVCHLYCSKRLLLVVQINSPLSMSSERGSELLAFVSFLQFCLFPLDPI